MTTALANLVASWATWYSDSAVLRTSVGFAHVAGLLVGGGCAVVADRATLVAARSGPGDRSVQLRLLHQAHKVVVVGLAVITVSGLLLLVANLETYLGSWVFWLKMACVAVLLINGAILVRTGQQADAGHGRAWARLRYASIVSLALWFLTTLLGAALPNV